MEVLNDLLFSQDKLAHFRIKELKDVLTQLGLSKQGKKQVECNILLMFVHLSHFQMSSALFCYSRLEEMRWERKIYLVAVLFYNS